jgi:hypothetical protein
MLTLEVRPGRRPRRDHAGYPRGRDLPRHPAGRDRVRPGCNATWCGAWRSRRSCDLRRRRMRSATSVIGPTHSAGAPDSSSRRSIRSKRASNRSMRPFMAARWASTLDRLTLRSRRSSVMRSVRSSTLRSRARVWLAMFASWTMDLFSRKGQPVVNFRANPKQALSSSRIPHEIARRLHERQDARQVTRGTSLRFEAGRSALDPQRSAARDPGAQCSRERISRWARARRCGRGAPSSARRSRSPFGSAARGRSGRSRGPGENRRSGRRRDKSSSRCGTPRRPGTS